MIVQLSERLKEERKRLSLTQDQMAAAGGVAKRTYCNYEAGTREPSSEFLDNLKKNARADWGYLIFGIRSFESLGSEANEERMISMYRELSTEDKISIEALVMSMMNPEYLDMLARLRDTLVALPPPDQKEILTPEEIALLDNFRNCPPEGKTALKTTSAALAQPKPGRRAG